MDSLHDWARFLDARSDEEAAAALARQVTVLDDIYNELRAACRPLWTSPTPEIAEGLMVARASLAEAIGLLERVQGRFRSGEREIA